MKKSLFALLVTVFALFFVPNFVFAKEKVSVYLFRSSTCSVCKSAVAFFDELSKDSEYGNMFEVVDFEVSSKKNSQLMQDAAQIMGDGEISGVPYIVIGDKSFGGYTSSWNDDIKAKIKETYEDDDFKSPLADLLGSSTDEGTKDTVITVGILLVAFIIIGGTIALARRGSDTSMIEEEEKMDVSVEETKQETDEKHEVKMKAKKSETKAEMPKQTKKKQTNKSTKKGKN